MDIQTRKLHFTEFLSHLQIEIIIFILRILLKLSNKNIKNASLLDHNNNFQQANERLQQVRFTLQEKFKTVFGNGN